MKLTLFTDYGLRALMYLVWHPDRLCTTREVADFYAISHDHVIKTVGRLTQLGLVQTRRGRRGGFELAKPADQIRLGDVVQSLEGELALLDCLQTDGTCTIERACRLRGVLARAQDQLVDFLNRYSLKEIAGPATPARVPLSSSRVS